MIIDWALVTFLIFMWLLVAAFAAVPYMDINRYRRRPNYAQSFAHTVLWPIILPLLMVKAGLGFVAFVVEVIKEIPSALNDIWRWK